MTIGLGAKLATINRDKKLTTKEVIFHSAVAFACAWVVWFILTAVGLQHEANIVAVIIGRFGDSMLLALGKAIQKAVLNIVKSDTDK